MTPSRTPDPNGPLVNGLLNHLFRQASIVTVEKPWGHELVVNTGELQLKYIYFKRGHACSLQYHRLKREVIHIMDDGDGAGHVEIRHAEGTDVFHAGETIQVQPGLIHRSYGPLELLEVSTFHPDDVVRLEDAYGRSE